MPSRRKGLQRKRGTSGLTKLKGFFTKLENNPKRKARIKKLQGKMKHGFRP